MPLKAVSQESPSGEITAEAYLVVDFKTGKILAEKNSNEPRQIASLTKVATAFVTLAWLDTAGPGAEQNVTTVEENRLAGGANPLRLKAGDKISVETTIYAALMGSDNASAEVVAEYVGRQINPKKRAWQAVEVFVEKMNDMTTQLGMVQTKFVNPHGLEKPDKLGVSTARDMARLALVSLRHKDFLKYCSSREKALSYTRAGVKKTVTIQHTHELMGSRGVDGIKTGTTQRAGECLMTTATREIPNATGTPEQHRLVVIVLGSKSRFSDTVLLLDQGWSEYQKWFKRGKPVTDKAELLSLGQK